MKKWNIIVTFFTFSLIFTQNIQLQLANLDSINDNYTIDVLINSNVDIAGFQFQAIGGILSNASGGMAAENQFIISSSGFGVVLAFDFSGGVIPAGEGTLVQLTFSEITESEICIEVPIFSDLYGNEYDIDTGECFFTGQGNAAPSVNILEPQDETTIIGNTLTLSLMNSDPNNIGYHYHLYLNNLMIGMFYENYFNLENLEWGTHTLTVILADSSHTECTEASCSETVSFTLQEPESETLELTITDVDPVMRSFQIYSDNSLAFTSFEFNITGVQPINISGGGVNEYNFVINIFNNSIDGVSFTNSFPEGNHHFATIYYDNPIDNEICLTHLDFIDINGFAMNSTTNGCIEIVLPENEYYTLNLPESGINQLFYFSPELESLQPGDEIGIFDQMGTDTQGADCNNLINNEVLVGAGLMLYDGISIIATGSINMCDFGGFVTPGFNLGNPISIKIYRPSEMMEYHTENVIFSNGSGTFTELFTEITSLQLVEGLTNSAPNAIIDQEQVETFRYADITLNGSNSFDPDGNIASFNWYINGEELIGTEETLTYQFTALGDYIITLVVIDNEGTIGSAVSLINVINQAPLTFNLISPENGDLFHIDSVNYIDEYLTFSWNQSIDLDGDPISYNCLIYIEEEQIIDFSTDENQYFIPYSSGFLGLEWNEELIITWKVIATDGYDNVETIESTFTLTYGNLSNNLVEINEFSLSQNYPNPFNPNTTIRLKINKSEHLSLNIFNISGEHIIQLLNGKQNIGIQTIDWNGNDKNDKPVPSGLYIYKLKTKTNNTIIKTMTLLK